MQLARRRGLRGLAESVDPDRRQSERIRRHDIVEVALRDMYVMIGRGTRLGEEAIPVCARRFVRADLRGDDGELERHADLLHRAFDEVTIGVGEDRELPAARAYVLERRAHLREG